MKLNDSPLLPHLIIQSLNTRNDEPCIFLSGRTASYKEIRERTSQMIQVLQSIGIKRGSRVAVLSKNRPEVLTNLTASLINGSIVTPLHPMGSFSDHSYIINDAEIDCLVFDSDYFSDRASELKALYPKVQFLGFGPNSPHLFLSGMDDPRLSPAQLGRSARGADVKHPRSDRI